MSEARTTYVLVVDDNPASALACEKVVGKVPRCVPKSFTKPGEALEWAREHLPALLVVDFRMPEMDGLEFIRQFRTIPNRSAVPCVMLTGITEASIRQEAMKLGVIDFLNKPTSVDRLMAHVAKAIGNT
jgi:putative two-component system response regulator